MLHIIARLADADMIARVTLEETTTIGVRMRPADRYVLDREVVSVQIPGGQVRIKVSRLEGRTLTVSPEYEDCARIAQETGRPFPEVRDAAVQSYRDVITSG